MKLWLIKREIGDVGYDEYDSAVVAAPDEASARNTHPDPGREVGRDPFEKNGFASWCDTPDKVTVTFLSDGYDGEAGSILGSFNAG